MRGSSRRLVTGALIAALLCSSCGDTTFRVTGTPAEERAKTGAVNAVTGFWHAFTVGDGRTQCRLASRRLVALRRAMGGTCAPSAYRDAPSLGLDIHDTRPMGRKVLVLAGGHGAYESHRLLFTTIRDAGAWKVDAVDLLPPRSKGIDR